MTHCANCDAALTGPYCAQCGQSAVSPAASIREFVSHTLGDAVSMDSRLIRSMRALFLNPGLLTVEYLAGRRVRYTPPAQLYLIAAALFFFTGTFRPFLWIDAGNNQVVGALPGVTVGNNVATTKLAELDAAGVPIDLFAERFQDAVQGWMPAFLIGSVVLFSLALYGLYFNRERRYIPHVIFALHWASFYLVVIAVTRLFPKQWGMQIAALVCALLYLAVALRRAYGQRLPVTIGKAVLLVILFFMILVLWVQSALSLGMLLA